MSEQQNNHELEQIEQSEQQTEAVPEKNGVKAGVGAIWIFIFVIAVFLLLDHFVLTPFIDWIGSFR